MTQEGEQQCNVSSLDSVSDDLCEDGVSTCRHGHCIPDADDDSKDTATVCVKQTSTLREHTASLLGLGIVGGYVAITAFVSVKAALMAASEVELMQVLERLNQNFGGAIGFVLGYYFATKTNGSSNGSSGSREK